MYEPDGRRSSQPTFVYLLSATDSGDGLCMNHSSGTSDSVTARKERWGEGTRFKWKDTGCSDRHAP